MQVAKWNTVRSRFETCALSGRECSGRQMRYGFFVLNLMAWLIILAGIELLMT